MVHQHDNHSRQQLRQILAPTTPIQPKLTIGAANDRFEQEADQMADKVMGMPDDALRNPAQPLTSLGPDRSIQRLCQDCEAQENPDEIQRMPVGEEENQLRAKTRSGSETSVPTHFASAIAGLNNGGMAMPGTDRAFFEPRFGKRFNQVKIHTGTQASQLASTINARAFTYGNHIVFGNGEYQPGSDAGKHLMAHELAHVVQQNGQVSRTIRRRPSISRWEFHNQDGTTTAKDNCCEFCNGPKGPRPLGVGNRYDNSILNGVELMPFIKDHEEGATYDIGRVAEGGFWEKYNEKWKFYTERERGEDDDPNDHDECLIPRLNAQTGEHYIYSEDQPGWRNLPQPHPVATEWSMYQNFVEYVTITDKEDFTATDPNVQTWHSILRIKRVGTRDLSIDKANSRIEPGFISLSTPPE